MGLFIEYSQTNKGCIELFTTKQYQSDGRPIFIQEVAEVEVKMTKGGNHAY